MMEQKVRVLLIDDDEDDLLLARDYLEEAAGQPFEISSCDNFEEGLAKVLNGEADVYLIDYRLGGKTGIDLLREVKDRGAERAIIVLTGLTDNDVDIQAMEMGAFDYLVKGQFGSRELIRSIRYAIERRKGKDALTLQAEILKNVHDAVFYVNEEGIVLNWNDGAVRIFETPESDAVGKSLLEVCPHDAPHPFFNRLVPVAEIPGAEPVIQCRLKSGKVVTILAKITKMSIDGQSGYVVCASDITKQRRLESEILRVSEDEQQRIGQDIHDDLCSQLSGIGMMTKVLENQLRVNHEKEAELLAEISGMVAEAGQKARHIARGLVPSALETQGLTGAVHEMADRSGSLFGVECIATVLGNEVIDSLDSMVGIQLLRIAQEATTNAMKHSDAELIHIRLTGEDGKVTLEVSDDGKGITEDTVSNGMGMMTMRKRAEMINADFELHSFAGRGTRITCSIRLPKDHYAC